MPRLRLPTSASALVPAAVAVGFEFHHARPGYVMLTRWLPTDAGPSPLPACPHHQFGVGGMVTNSKGQVLCIQEKSGRTGFWKLPGGLVDPGEDVAAAVLSGGNVRVGLEDNLWLEKGHLATNAELVARAVTIVEAMGVQVMTPEEVRAELQLTKRALP